MLNAKALPAVGQNKYGTHYLWREETFLDQALQKTSVANMHRLLSDVHFFHPHPFLLLLMHAGSNATPTSKSVDPTFCGILQIQSMWLGRVIKECSQQSSCNVFRHAQVTLSVVISFAVADFSLVRTAYLALSTRPGLSRQSSITRSLKSP